MHLGRSRSRDNDSAGLDPETGLGRVGPQERAYKRLDPGTTLWQKWIQRQHLCWRKSRCSTWAVVDSETALSQKWIPETPDSTEEGVDPEAGLNLIRDSTKAGDSETETVRRSRRK